MTQPKMRLENEMSKSSRIEEELLDICPFLKTLCLDASDNDLENYCALNYENCEKYIEYEKRIKK